MIRFAALVAQELESALGRHAAQAQEHEIEVTRLRSAAAEAEAASERAKVAETAAAEASAAAAAHRSAAGEAEARANAAESAKARAEALHSEALAQAAADGASAGAGEQDAEEAQAAAKAAALEWQRKHDKLQLQQDVSKKTWVGQIQVLSKVRRRRVRLPCCPAAMLPCCRALRARAPCTQLTLSMTLHRLLRLSLLPHPAAAGQGVTGAEAEGGGA